MKALLTIIAALTLGGCGSMKVSGETKHTVQGTATIRFEIDVSICDSLPEADRAACISALIELANNASKKKEAAQ